MRARIAPRQARRAVALLGVARSALMEEIHAAGYAEAQQHPTLRKHWRVVDRIDRFLAAVGKGPR